MLNHAMLVRGEGGYMPGGEQPIGPLGGCAQACVWPYALNPAIEPGFGAPQWLGSTIRLLTYSLISAPVKTTAKMIRG